MQELFDILVEGRVIHKGISQEMFFDIMEELSMNFYETGFPHPDTISHICYTED